MAYWMDSMLREHEALEYEIARLTAELTAARADADRLAAKGRHAGFCRTRAATGDMRCNCGWDKALAQHATPHAMSDGTDGLNMVRPDPSVGSTPDTGDE